MNVPKNNVKTLVLAEKPTMMVLTLAISLVVFQNATKLDVPEVDAPLFLIVLRMVILAKCKLVATAMPRNVTMVNVSQSQLLETLANLLPVTKVSAKDLITVLSLI
jgi:hypothetical protein